MQQAPRPVIDFTLSQVSALYEERHRVTAKIDKDIAEYVGFLREQGVEVPADPYGVAKATNADAELADFDNGDNAPSAYKRGMRGRVIGEVVQMLAAGVPVPMNEIERRLKASGIDVNAGNPRRLLKFMSEADEFTFIRGHGWALVQQLVQEHAPGGLRLAGAA